MSTAIRRQWERLRRRIERHNYLYYVEDAPAISDRNFDRLMRRLIELERRYPQLVTADSPTQRVGGRPIEGFRTVRHRVPMLSIENTYNERDLRQFDARIRRLLTGAEIRYVVEQKIDGVSVSLIYENGRLVVGATRGDGLHGDDVTANLKTIRDIPLRLRTAGRPPKLLEVRGEAYLTNSQLARLIQRQKELGERLFANSRNAAAGSLKLLDPRLCAERGLRFFAHTEARWKGPHVATHLEFLDLIHGFGLPTVPHSGPLESIDEVLAFERRQLEERHSFDYEMDGLVVKVDDLAQREKLGTTDKAPRWAIAYKVELWQARTRINDIYVQVGKTGAITPVARLEPVKIAGSTISRVSLFNADEIRRKDVRVGDIAVVEKAGKVIPHVVRIELEKRRRGSRRYRFPNRCPACGERIARDEGGVYVRCTNRTCPGRLKEHLRYFAHRQAMNIEGLGPALVDQLVDRGLVRSLPDLYRLTVDRLTELEHCGRTSAQKLLDEIAASKDRELVRLLTGLGIRHVGVRHARLLADEFGTIDALTRAPEERIAGVPGVGAVVAHSVYRYFRSATGRKTVRELRALGVSMSARHPTKRRSGKLAGKTVVITGTLANMTREQAEEAVSRGGGKPTSSVSRATDLVVVGKKPGSKFDKARKLGIRTLTDKQFVQIVGASNSSR
ncbi:MAG: NAD-dependent DNA ligase LigA [Planctomycetaceae bacterium]|nr:NAD-dependent DNA ligase LigA [Planctomycetaceae bacterium]